MFKRTAATAAAFGILGIGMSVLAPVTAHADDYCGNFTYAGPNTSCDFALIVHDAYLNSPGMQVVAYSPVTHLNYVMNCVRFYSGRVECRGGNNAVVELF